MKRICINCRAEYTSENHSYFSNFCPRCGREKENADIAEQHNNGVNVEERKQRKLGV